LELKDWVGWDFPYIAVLLFLDKENSEKVSCKKIEENIKTELVEVIAWPAEIKAI